MEKEFVKLESTIGVHGVMYEIIEQAKAMEKEQIKDAIDYCRDKYIDSENYYNETYKEDKQ